MRSPAVILFAAACVCVSGRPAMAQTPAGASGRTVVVDIQVSSAEMRRNAALATASGEVLSRLTDKGLDHLFGPRDGRGWKQVLGRIGATYFLTLPIATIGHTLAHEAGHIARIHDAGVGVDRLRIDHWPWLVPYLRAEVVLGQAAADKLTHEQWLGVIGGGSEASQLQADALVDRVFSRDRASYFDWILLAYAKLDMPIYVWRDLRESRLGSLSSFHEDKEHMFGDPRGYVLNFATIREARHGYDQPGLDAIRAVSDQLREGAWLNLFDFTLWAGLSRAATYITTGTRETDNPMPKVRGVGILPGAHFVMTPVGLERGAGVRLVTSALITHLDFRRTDTPAGSHLWGGTIALLPRLRTTFAPSVRADVWQRAGESPGYRIAVGGARDVQVAGKTMGATLDVGYKTRGYVAGSLERRGLIATIGAAIRF